MTTRSANRSWTRYKTELIADRVWRTNAQLELATVAYVGWFNHRRLHSSIGNRPPDRARTRVLGAGRARARNVRWLRPPQQSLIYETS